MGARSVCGHVGFVFGKDNKVIKVSFSHTKSHSNSSVSWLPILPEGYQYSQPHPTQPLCPNLALWLWRCLDAGILAHHSLPFHQCCSWSHLCCRLGLNSLKEELQFQWIPRRWGFVPCTPFPIWNQSVVPCPVLTIASWLAYRFLRRQVRWSGILTSWRIFHSLLWSTQPNKGFGIVNKAEVDVFLKHSSFLMMQRMLAIWSLKSLPFLNPA